MSQRRIDNKEVDKERKKESGHHVQEVFKSQAGGKPGAGRVSARVCCADGRSCREPVGDKQRPCCRHNAPLQRPCHEYKASDIIF